MIAGVSLNMHLPLIILAVNKESVTHSSVSPSELPDNEQRTSTWVR